MSPKDFQQMPRKIISQLGRFALIGMIGFTLDACMTLALIHRGIDPFTARVFAIVLAMMVTWRLNRALTFGASPSSQASEGARYFSVALFAAAMNYGIYVGLLLVLPGIHTLIAIMIAVGAVTALSFVG